MSKRQLKTRVVSRAFYEDAYLEFFIEYYLALGFDNIVILKSDTTEFPTNKYPVDRVLFVPVLNTGDKILNDHIGYYIDTDYDWVLNVDIDEFLIIDMDKFANIKEYLEDMTARYNPDQIMYWWICIHNMGVWPHDRTEPVTMLNYINGTYPLHFFNYVKSMARPSRVDRTDVMCHFFRAPNTNPKNMRKDSIISIGDFKNILDGGPAKIKTDLPANPVPNTFCDGFILHVYTRSMANALTKNLVSRVHKSVYFKNGKHFSGFLENIPNTPGEITVSHRKTLYGHMQGKATIPKQIVDYSKSMIHNLDMTNARRLLNTIIAHMPCVSTYPFVSLVTEWAILEKLAKEKHFKFDKLQTLLLGLNHLASPF